MKTMLRVAAFGAVSLVAISAPTARAEKLYTFVVNDTTAGPAPLPKISLDLTDSQVRNGVFNLSGIGNGGVTPHGGFPPTLTGDVGGFTVLWLPEQVRPDYLYGRLQISLKFDSAGNVTSTDLHFAGTGSGLDIAGVGDAGATGTLKSDNPYLCPLSAGCAFSGAWFDPPAGGAAVPEPASLVLLGMGLLGLTTLAGRRK